LRSRCFSKKGVARAVAILMLSGALVGEAGAEPVVVVNNTNPISSIGVDELRLIYNGGKKFFEAKLPIQPAGLEPENPVRREFFSRWLHVGEESYRLYWLRMIFSGKGKPPVELKTEEDVLKYVAERKGGLAYVDSESVTEQVKVIQVTE